ncbi:hypothetical protein C4A76_24720 [Brevibacillus laterosporus]|nr:hypothetical protein C4A76_24720 [Brevibacillus laterosporus]
MKSLFLFKVRILYFIYMYPTFKALVWLDREVQDGKLLESLLLPYDENQMKAYPVSKMVGNVRYDIPDCIAEI